MKLELKNKVKIPVMFPYAENTEFKKLGVKWDSTDKYWYYPSVDGKLPDNLKDFEKKEIYIEYDDKEFYKTKLKSLRWDKTNKKWYCSQKELCNLQALLNS